MIFQVWVNDAYLIGHLTDFTKHEAEEYKHAYAKKVWDDDVKASAVSLCEIPPNYYN